MISFHHRLLKNGSDCMWFRVNGIGGGSIYKVGGPDAERRRCQRGDGGRSERRGQKPLSTFHLEVVKFFSYFEGHFDKFVFPG